MAWFEETYQPSWRQRLKINKVLHRERTGHQELVIFESVDFGRVLALDGVVQLTERDEFIYHEMISHVPLVAHGAPRAVLIIGGGDGGTLEEVLKHQSVAQVTMVELDPAVVARSRDHFPKVGQGRFDDPRTRLVFADGVEFVATTDQRFDVIIVDSTDEAGPGGVLFSDGFYRDCHARLRPGGVIVTQIGNPFGEEHLLADNQRRLGAAFADVGFYTTAVPTYFGGLFAFGFASDDPAKRRLTLEQLRTRSLPDGLRQYTPAVHAAAFVHAPWLLAAAGGAAAEA